MHQTDTHQTRLQRGQLTGLSILIIDDSIDYADMLALRLLRAGAFAMSVNSGKSALRIVETFQFDVILCDVNMPEMNGLECLRAVRELGITTPCILVTALCGQLKFSPSDTSYIAAQLGKPTDLRALVETIQGVFTLQSL